MERKDDGLFWLELIGRHYFSQPPLDAPILFRAWSSALSRSLPSTAGGAPVKPLSLSDNSNDSYGLVYDGIPLHAEDFIALWIQRHLVPVF